MARIKLKPLNEQVIVITGASSGIGLVTARMAAKRGARLMVAARSEESLQRLVDEIKAQGGEAVYVAADISRSEDVERIAQASIVNDDTKLAERVEFIHRQTKTHAIAEQYIAGREIYVSVIGNQRLQTYTPWELVIEKLPEGAPNIATSKLKWDPAYQEKVGVVTKAADLDKEMREKLKRLSKRIYRTLFLSGYARLDYRVTDDGRIFLLEANPNSQIARDEDFADSAKHSGLDYESLLQKIITLGLSYRSGA